MEQKDKMILLYDMWKGENSVKTNKLMVFFVVQAILVSAFKPPSLSGIIVPISGVLFSVIWFFCIGRTVAFQKVWAKKIREELASMNEETRGHATLFPTTTEKVEIPLYGKMPSIYILLCPPVATAFLWALILVHIATSKFAAYMLMTFNL